MLYDTAERNKEEFASSNTLLVSVPNPKRSVAVDLYSIINEDNTAVDSLTNFDPANSSTPHRYDIPFNGWKDGATTPEMFVFNSSGVAQPSSASPVPLMLREEGLNNGSNTDLMSVENKGESNSHVNLVADDLLKPKTNRDFARAIQRPASTPIQPKYGAVGTFSSAQNTSTGLFNNSYGSFKIEGGKSWRDSVLPPNDIQSRDDLSVFSSSFLNFNQAAGEKRIENSVTGALQGELFSGMGSTDNITLESSKQSLLEDSRSLQWGGVGQLMTQASSNKNSSLGAEIGSSDQLLFNRNNIGGFYGNRTILRDLGSLLPSFGGTASAPPLQNARVSGFSHTHPMSQRPPIAGDLESKEFHVRSHLHHSPLPSVSPGLSNSIELNEGNAVTDAVINRNAEEAVTRSCVLILVGAAEHALKAVELANTLRARVGTDALATIRERWGGLLSLLENHPFLFRVDRIPKSDKVTLLLALPPSASEPNLKEINILITTYFQRNPHLLASSGSQAENDTAMKQGTDQSARMIGSQQQFSTGVRNQQATRCLHVGNVPSNMTEVQLMFEFQKFGQIDGLKLVTQRNGSRRFAFVTFHTIEQAVTARQCLSKIHPWKSAISFAHKEFGPQAQQSNTSKYHQMQSTATDYGIYRQQNGNLEEQYNSNSIHFSYPNSFPNASHSQDSTSGAAPAYRITLPQPGLPTQNQAMFYPYANMNHHQQIDQHSGDAANFQHYQPQYYQEFIPSNIQSQMPSQHQMHQAQQYPIQQMQRKEDESEAASLSNMKNNSILNINMSSTVLRRLCDDCWVPTQPWPIDRESDAPFCQHIIAQLQQFGGSTTVSKLRGFLRNRIEAEHNIKSVPLKALLSAYSEYFCLDGNFVSLSQAISSTLQDSSQQQYNM